MAVVASAEEYGKGVTRDGVAANGALALVVRSGQVAIDAKQVGLAMNLVGLILNLVLVAGRAKGVSGYRFAGVLGVDFVTVNAGNPHLAVPA